VIAATSEPESMPEVSALDVIRGEFLVIQRWMQTKS
jgi:hypothetical protein